MKTYTMDLTRHSEPISVAYLSNTPFLVSKPSITFKPAQKANSANTTQYRSTKSHNNLNQEDSSRMASVQASDEQNNVQVLKTCTATNKKKNINGIFQGKVLIVNRQKNTKIKNNVYSKINKKQTTLSYDKSRESPQEQNLKIFLQYYKKYSKSEIDRIKHLQNLNLTAIHQPTSLLLTKRKASYPINKENYKNYQEEKIQANPISLELGLQKKDEDLSVNGNSYNSTNPRLSIYRSNVRKGKINSKVVDPIQLDEHFLPTQNNQSAFQPYFKQEEKFQGRKSFDQYTSLHINKQNQDFKEKPILINSQSKNIHEMSSAFITRKSSQIALQNDENINQKTSNLIYQQQLSNSIPKKGAKISASRALQYFCQIFKRQNLDRMVIKKTHVNNSKEINAKKIILQQRRDSNINQGNARSVLTHKKRNSISTARPTKKCTKQKATADQNFEIAGWDVDF